MNAPFWTELPSVEWAQLPKNPHQLAKKVFSPRSSGLAYPQLLVAIQESDNSGLECSAQIKLTSDPTDGWADLGAEAYPTELHTKVVEMYHEVTSQMLCDARAGDRNDRR